MDCSRYADRLEEPHTAGCTLPSFASTEVLLLRFDSSDLPALLLCRSVVSPQFPGFHSGLPRTSHLARLLQPVCTPHAHTTGVFGDCQEFLHERALRYCKISRRGARTKLPVWFSVSTSERYETIPVTMEILPASSSSRITRITASCSDIRTRNYRNRVVSSLQLRRCAETPQWLRVYSLDKNASPGTSGQCRRPGGNCSTAHTPHPPDARTVLLRPSCR